MRLKIVRILVVLIMLAGLGGTGYFWYLKFEADHTILGLQDEIETGKKRLSSAQKKYTQEKAKLGNCMRMNLDEKSRNAKLQDEISALTAEKEAFAVQKAALEKKHQAELASVKDEIVKLNADKEKLILSRDKLMEKYQQTEQNNREKTEEIGTLSSEIKDLKSQLKLTENSLDRTRKHNTKLCVIAEELTRKYREEAGEGDPFTKLKMVEIEHLIQEYIKRIDKEKIIEQ